MPSAAIANRRLRRLRSFGAESLVREVALACGSKPSVFLGALKHHPPVRAQRARALLVQRLHVERGWTSWAIALATLLDQRVIQRALDARPLAPEPKTSASVRAPVAELPEPAGPTRVVATVTVETPCPECGPRVRCPDFCPGGSLDRTFHAEAGVGPDGRLDGVVATDVESGEDYAPGALASAFGEDVRDAVLIALEKSHERGGRDAAAE